MEWNASLNEFEKLVIRMNTPRVVIDNVVCPNATLVKVDSMRKHGILLEAVQVLTDLNLCIKKAYISSDGRWFMDVFHVTDQNGNKLTDESVLSYIKQSLATSNGPRANGFKGLTTALELTGTDRPGLLSEVFAVLAELQCNVVEAKVWTHNGRIASLIYVKDDEDSGSFIKDSQKISRIEGRLRNVLKGDNDIKSAKTAVSLAAVVTHTERRLHQMMFADRDYELKPTESSSSPSPPLVSVQDWSERGYSVVNIQSNDRPKLLFDIICTLTDMEYVVFHATIDTACAQAYQEFYIRHTDGSPISSEAERQRVIQCLQAAIERRASQGVSLELCTTDRHGLLSDVTRTFRENGLSVTRAEISTTGETAANVFYVTDAAGHPVESKTIEAVRQRIGLSSLKVKEPSIVDKESSTRDGNGGGVVGLFSLGSLVKRNLYNLGLIRSCS
ncbi:ACT domain-containing protein ACR8-like [Tasmannia lanceolata]|uniref:ACT domain-containing protein ACR8-like n=1 Tax=Tasmannia lanceolata TaxID=3420 RepID=UPI0040629DBF